jgi:homoserine O-acetyltransferase
MKIRGSWVRFLGLVAIGVLAVSSGWAQEGVQKIAELGECPLSSGKVVLDCRIGYRTFGVMNADGTNVVVMPSWLNGRSEDLAPFFGEKSTGHRLVDTSRFFGVAFDAFGDGVSSSPSNSKRQHGPEFPVFNMEDMVRAQYRVLTEGWGTGVCVGGFVPEVFGPCSSDRGNAAGDQL